MGKRSRKRSLLAHPGDGGAPTDEGGRPPTSRAERDAERRRRRVEASASADSGQRRRGAASGYGVRERPSPPWGGFPLSELVVLLAVIIGIASFFVAGAQSTVMLVAAFSLGGLAGLELAVREHFAGYRSHTTLLAAFAAFAAGAVVVVAIPGPPPRVPTVIVAFVVFGVAFWQFREVFKRRSGGLGFR